MFDSFEQYQLHEKVLPSQGTNSVVWALIVTKLIPRQAKASGCGEALKLYSAERKSERSTFIPSEVVLNLQKVHGAK